MKNIVASTNPSLSTGKQSLKQKRVLYKITKHNLAVYHTESGLDKKKSVAQTCGKCIQRNTKNATTKQKLTSPSRTTLDKSQV